LQTNIFKFVTELGKFTKNTIKVVIKKVKNI